MIPLGFPVLLLGPAIFLDLLWPKLNGIQGWHTWLRRATGAVALAAAAPFIAVNLLATKQKQEAWNKWLQATLAGIVFVAALVAVQWPFANFLMSPLARNGVFGTIYHPYMVPSEWFGVRNLFRPFEGMGPFAIRMALAVFAATMCTRLGIMFGNWMRKVQR